MSKDTAIDIPMKDLNKKDSSHGVPNSKYARKLRNGIIRTVTINFIMPLIIYGILSEKISLVWALILSGIPSTLDGMYYIYKTRKLDALASIVVLSIVFSIVVVVATDDPKLILLKDSIMTLFFSTGFWLSLLLKEDLIWGFYRQLSGNHPVTVHTLDKMYQNPFVQKTTRIMCMVWGTGLLFEAATRIVLIYTISTYVLGYVSYFLFFGAMTGLSCWTFWYIHKTQVLKMNPEQEKQIEEVTEDV